MQYGSPGVMKRVYEVYLLLLLVDGVKVTHLKSVHGSIPLLQLTGNTREGDLKDLGLHDDLDSNT